MEIDAFLLFLLIKPNIIQLMHSFEVDIIQLLTNEALDMMWYRPENTNIDLGEHHIQCLISQ